MSFNPNIPFDQLPLLPPASDLETKDVLLQLSRSHRFLAELKGVSKTMPNQGILISTLPLLEAKDSSAIENIITTHDDLYKENLFADFLTNPRAKEVQNYSRALLSGYENLIRSKLLTNRQILEIQEEIEANRAGFRKLPGTALVNDRDNQVIYTPPGSYDVILKCMGNLEKFINDDSFCNLDPLIKMAVIHYQFESIHPFYDGNGRTGRIINILYLVQKELLDIPVLYLSRYIIKNKDSYYRLLQQVRTDSAWHEWVIFMLKGVEETAQETVRLIHEIRRLMADYKVRIRNSYKFYSQELLNNLFSHPYTKIEFLEKDIGVHRQTAAKYLDTLAGDGFIQLKKIGKHNYYINQPLFELFSRSDS